MNWLRTINSQEVTCANPFTLQTQQSSVTDSINKNVTDTTYVQLHLINRFISSKIKQNKIKLLCVCFFTVLFFRLFVCFIHYYFCLHCTYVFMYVYARCLLCVGRKFVHIRQWYYTGINTVIGHMCVCACVWADEREC